jgi:RimJ/RimL family protein N-acetyltransferase/N-acetylglutamate synthase-like GNAT family acetyltransferase
LIRPLRDHDIPELAHLWRELRPDAVHSEQGLRHLVESFPPRAEAAHWIADDGAVVAWCFAHRRWRRASSNGYVWIGVLPEARRRGLGSELWELAGQHLSAVGVERVNADAVGDAEGERFLRRRGLVQRRTVVVSAADPCLVDPAELATRRERAELDGYRLLPYAEADLHSLYRLDMEAIDDEPGEEAPHELSFEEWRRDLLESPDLTHEGSFVVVASGEAVAHSGLSVDRGSRRGRNEGTGTAAAQRGRGLATLAKLAQLRWAAEQGIERVITDNDERNAPMLAINRRLGYVPFVERRGFVKELSGRAGTASGPARAAPGR